MVYYNDKEDGSPIAIKDEGITVVSSAASINFVGSGVSVSAIGRDVTVTISGGGGGGVNISVEKLVGTQSGSNVTLNLAGLAHTFTAVLFIIRQGQVVTPGNNGGYGWTLSGSTVTVYGADASEDFLVEYTY